jgi:hypothetical protein
VAAHKALVQGEQGPLRAAALYNLGNLHLRQALGGQRGEDLVVLAGQAIRGVAPGVGATAAIQSLLGGLGPLILIFVGVVGGLVAFGLVGIFVGLAAPERMLICGFLSRWRRQHGAGAEVVPDQATRGPRAQNEAACLPRIAKEQPWP